jgi:hypothetical protein
MMNLKSKVIKHWEENLERVKNKERPCTGSATCAYCQKYIETDCIDCPIQIATDKVRCRGTPYPLVMKVVEKLRELHFSSNVESSLWAELTSAVEAELEFLRSLPNDSEEP